MNRPTKDLFDESTMTFGEHLEVLRVHVIKALLGLFVAAIVCLIYGTPIVGFIRKPIDDALRRYSQFEVEDDTVGMDTWQKSLYNEWGFDVMFGEWKDKNPDASENPAEEPVAEEELPHGTIRVEVPVDNLLKALHLANPDQFPAVKESQTAPGEGKEDEAKRTGKPAEKVVSLVMSAPQFAEFQRTTEQSRRAVTLKVEEAFTTYVKVSLIAALVVSSPWIFYQLWLFVAEGLYPHERKYVHIYGSLSLFLFLTGAFFSFYAVFPFVLKFLLGFNAMLEIHPQIRLSEWISFAVMLPVMFGISFQLPLVMLFLERISIFNAEAYREKRRLSILVIAFLSMVLTPADPMSMLLMMFPLIGLYELGILLCRWFPVHKPFETAKA